MAHQLPRTVAAQLRDVARRDPAEPMARRQLVEGRNEKREGVGQGAVEVEDGEAVGIGHVPHVNWSVTALIRGRGQQVYRRACGMSQAINNQR